MKEKRPKREGSEAKGYEPLPAAHDSEPLVVGGEPIEPGDELLILQENRPAAAVRVVHVGARRAWVRVAVDLVGARSSSAEMLIGPGTMVRRRE